jgi:hypothetical protein
MYAMQKWWEKAWQKRERSHQEKSGRELGLGLQFHSFLGKR